MADIFAFHGHYQSLNLFCQHFREYKPKLKIVNELLVTSDNFDIFMEKSHFSFIAFWMIFDKNRAALKKNRAAKGLFAGSQRRGSELA